MRLPLTPSPSLLDGGRHRGCRGTAARGRCLRGHWPEVADLSWPPALSWSGDGPPPPPGAGTWTSPDVSFCPWHFQMVFHEEANYPKGLFPEQQVGVGWGEGGASLPGSTHPSGACVIHQGSQKLNIKSGLSWTTPKPPIFFTGTLCIHKICPL